MSNLSKTKSNILLILLTGFITIVYVSLIFNENIWTDEAFSIQLVGNNNLPGIIKGTANDVHPPLYYLITKAFISLLGSSFQIYKIVSIIPMLLTMLLSIIYVRPWFGTKSALLFTLFLNAFPCVMEYSVQIRMYSWCIFFITLAGLSAYGTYIEGSFRHWLVLTVSSLCACYTHNFAMISAVFIYLILGIALTIKHKSFPVKWLLSGIIVSICYIPWLFVLLKQTNSKVNNYWIEPVTGSTIIGYFNDLFGSRLPFTTFIFIIIFVIAFILLILSKEITNDTRYYAIGLLLTPLFTAVVGILVSVLITPFFIARYLLPCMGLIALSLAICLGTAKNISYTLLCVFLSLMIGNSYYTNYLDEYCSTHTDELLNYMDSNMSENDIILYNYKLYGFVYECYFDSEKLCFLDDMDFNSDYENIWYFDSCISPWLPDATLSEHGLTKEYIATLGIEQNDFILYKIHR